MLPATAQTPRSLDRATTTKAASVKTAKSVRSKTAREPPLKCDEPTQARLAELGEAQCAPAETASALRVDVRSLNNFFRREPRARKAFEMGRARGLQGLRRAQLKLAETNASMAIFLGRAYLGQSEQREAEPGAFAFDASQAGQRLRDKISALAGAQAAGGDP